MPYELEYKKVHNTLSKVKNTNHYGYLMGDRLTYIDWSENIPLKDWDQYIMVQNLSNNDLLLSISFRDENNAGIGYPVVIVGSGYYFLPTDLLHVFVKCQIPANESFLIKLPATKEYYNPGLNQLVTPVSVKLQVPDAFDSNDLKVWYTQENIWTYEENDFIVNYIDTPWTTYLEWNEGQLLENIKEAIENATYNYDTSTNTFTAQNLNVSQTDLNTLNLSLVLVPCKYYSDDNPKLHNITKVLRSITNTRNRKQSSLYDEYWSPASAYIEPIRLTITNNTASMSFNAPVQWLPNPLYSEYIEEQQDMKEVVSLRGQTTYALENHSKTLILCQGCGYDNGASGGKTYITFGVGLQYIRPVNPHSGTGLEYLHITGITPIELKRLPLASKNAAIHPIILKKSQ